MKKSAPLILLHSHLLLLPLLLLFGLPLIYSQPGFISLDCGGTENFTDNLGIDWQPDTGYISGGFSANIMSNYSDQQYQTLRYFNESNKKYCYVLPVYPTNRYLVRATFLYGNFSDTITFPQFTISLGATTWSLIQIVNASEMQFQEIIISSQNQTSVSVCIMSGITGVAFISTLELRQLQGSLYAKTYDTTAYLVYAGRINFGALDSNIIRYPDDPVDRFWESDIAKKGSSLNNESPGTIRVNTTVNVTNSASQEKPPSKVMQTAVVGSFGNLTYRLGLPYFPSDAWAQAYLAEIEMLSSNETRKATFALQSQTTKYTGQPFNLAQDWGQYNVYEPGFANISLPELTNFAFQKTDDSVLGPILNAIEILRIVPIAQRTFSDDTSALVSLREKSPASLWAREAGDPCLPLSWEWVKCTSDSSPRVTDILLSSKNLTGSIPSTVSQLTRLENLWLDNNQLNDSIPDLSNLRNLTTLHLQNNQLSGPFPQYFADLPNLKELFVQNNSFSGVIPRSLIDNADLIFHIEISVYIIGQEEILVGVLANMSVRMSPATPRSTKLRPSRGENDLTPARPDKSVAGPKLLERKSPRTASTERRTIASKPSAELSQVLDELSKAKEAGAALERARNEALEEALQAKKNEEEISTKLSEALELYKKEKARAEEMEQASFTAAEDWQAELESLKNKYEAEACELQMTEEALQSLKKELLSAMEAKEEAVRLASEAMATAEVEAKKAEAISIELEVAKQSLLAIEANSDKGVKAMEAEMNSLKETLMADLISAKTAMAEAQSAHEKSTLKLSESEAEIEAAVNAMNRALAESEAFKEELSLIKDKEAESSKAIYSLESELAMAKNAVLDATAKAEEFREELEKARKDEAKANTLLNLIVSELEETKRKLEESNEENDRLISSRNYLMQDLEATGVELEEAKDRDLVLSSKVSALNIEVEKVKKELSNALGSEGEARGLLEDLGFSLEKAKEEIKALREEVVKVRNEAEMEREATMDAKKQALAAEEALQSAERIAISAKKRSDLAEEDTRKAWLSVEAAEADAKLAREDAELAREEAREKAAEAELAREEMQSAQREAESARSEAEAARLDVEVAWTELETSRVRAEEARREALEAKEEVEKERERGKAIKEEAEEWREEALRAREELEAAIAEARITQAASKSEICAEREKVGNARAELHERECEVEDLKAKLECLQRESKEATEANRVIQCQLQDALMKLEAMATIPSTSVEKGRRRNLSESFEMVDSVDPDVVAVNQEELDSLKLKLQEAETLLTEAKAESASAKHSQEELSMELEAALARLDASKTTEIRTQNELEIAEREKMKLQGEIERMKASVKETKHSDMMMVMVNGVLDMDGAASEASDDNQRLASLPMPDTTVMGNVLNIPGTTQKEEEEQKKIVAEVTPPNPKKKALLLRVGTFLKKKNHHTTPPEKSASTKAANLS